MESFLPNYREKNIGAESYWQNAINEKPYYINFYMCQAVLSALKLSFQP